MTQAPRDLDADPHWPGQTIFRKVLLVLAYLACLGSMLGHVGSYWEGVVLPVEGVVAIVVLVGVAWFLTLIYLNQYLRHAVGLSLGKAFGALNNPVNRKGKLREKQRKHLENLYHMARLWWRRLPLFVRVAILPGTLYLAFIWFSYVRVMGLPDQGLIPPGVGIALRMYSAVWFAISFLALALPAWCTHDKGPQSG